LNGGLLNCPIKWMGSRERRGRHTKLVVGILVQYKGVTWTGRPGVRGAQRGGRQKKPSTAENRRAREVTGNYRRSGE